MGVINHECRSGAGLRVRPVFFGGGSGRDTRGRLAAGRSLVVREHRCDLTRSRGAGAGAGSRSGNQAEIKLILPPIAIAIAVTMIYDAHIVTHWRKTAMTKLSNSESEFLSTWCETKKRLIAQDKAARETRDQLEAMKRELKKIVPRANETVGNGEWNVRYKNIPFREYTVPKKTRQKWTIKQQRSD